MNLINLFMFSQYSPLSMYFSIVFWFCCIFFITCHLSPLISRVSPHHLITSWSHDLIIASTPELPPNMCLKFAHFCLTNNWFSRTKNGSIWQRSALPRFPMQPARLSPRSPAFCSLLSSLTSHLSPLISSSHNLLISSHLIFHLSSFSSGVASATVVKLPPGSIY